MHVPKTGGSSVEAMFARRIDDSRVVEGRKRHASYQWLIAAEPIWTRTGRSASSGIRGRHGLVVVDGLRVFEKAERGDEKARSKIEKYPNAWLPEGEFRHDFDRFVLEGTEKGQQLVRRSP